MGDKLSRSPQKADDKVDQKVIADHGSRISNVIQNSIQIAVHFVDEQLFKKLGLEQRIGFAILGILVLLVGLLIGWGVYRIAGMMQSTIGICLPPVDRQAEATANRRVA